MIEIQEILEVQGSVYDVNIDSIRARMIEKYGEDVHLGYTFRTDAPDQVTVYKVIKDGEEENAYNK